MMAEQGGMYMPHPGFMPQGGQMGYQFGVPVSLFVT